MIASAVLATANATTVVYSDPDETRVPKFPCNALRRPNTLMWEDKFRAALLACKSDILLIIHADCESDDWSAVPTACRRAFTDVTRTGVWAPLIDGTIHNINKVQVNDLAGTPYALVTQSDGIVFAMSRPILERMKKADLTKNPYGWGIDTMVNCCCHALGLFSIIDRDTAVHHPWGAGYERDKAMAGMKVFLQQLTPEEEVLRLLMQTVARNARKAAAEPATDPRES